MSTPAYRPLLCATFGGFENAAIVPADHLPDGRRGAALPQKFVHDGVEEAAALPRPAFVGIVHRARNAGIAADGHVVSAHSVHQAEDRGGIGADGGEEVPHTDHPARIRDGLRFVRAQQAHRQAGARPCGHRAKAGG